MIPWEATLKSKVAQGIWKVFKGSLLHAQEHPDMQENVWIYEEPRLISRELGVQHPVSKGSIQEVEAGTG